VDKMVSLVERKLRSKIVSFQYVNTNYLKIDTDDKLYLDQLYDTFAVFVKDYQFMNMFRSGMWDGRIKFFDKLRKTLPVGLIREAFDYTKKFHRDKRVVLDKKLKEILFNKELENVPEEEFLLSPDKYERRPYQINAVKKALYHKRAVIRSPTASGKSYIIACMAQHLYDRQECFNFLIIVPTIQLVEQFYKDMIDYGMDRNKIGRIHGEIHEKMENWSKNFVITTWQSASRKIGKSDKLKWANVLKEFDGVVIDECHLALEQEKPKEIRKIITACTGTKYRLGFTGTLPSNECDRFSILAYIGPKVLEIPTHELIQQGYVSDLQIIQIHIEYDDPDSYKPLDWIEVKQKVLVEPKRLELISKICGSSTKNTLMLVSFVETEGKILQEYLKKHFPEKEIHFIYGDVKVDDREDVRLAAEHKNNMVIIATYGTFKLGLNIKNLHRIVFASPLKAEIANLQSIGRGLRVLPNKKLIVYDIVDWVKFLKRHGKERASIFVNEKYDVKSYKT